MPKVSVIIPCHNQEHYLEEAIDSVLRQTFQDFEIIVVNNGSAEETAYQSLACCGGPKVKVIHTSNRGLAEARNEGIRLSTGEYLLPLDADDKIGREYLAQAVKLLDRKPELKIVYCQAKYFGEKKGRVKTPGFSMEEMLIHNLIFNSAFFRRRDFDATIGYNPNMQGGWEDWDFWLSLLQKGGGVYQIPKVLFFYRIRKNSMAQSLAAEDKLRLRQLIFLNHPTLYVDHFPVFARKYYRLLDSPDYKLGRLLLSPLRWAGKIANKKNERPCVWDLPEQEQIRRG